MSVRVQMLLNDSRYERLQALMETCHLSNQRDLMNNALAMFEWAVRQRLEGRSIASVGAEGDTVRELSMPVLDDIHAPASSGKAAGAR